MAGLELETFGLESICQIEDQEKGSKIRGSQEEKRPKLKLAINELFPTTVAVCLFLCYFFGPWVEQLWTSLSLK